MAKKTTKSKKKIVKGEVVWGKDLDKKIADIKEQSKKNGGFFVYVVTIKKGEKFDHFEGALVSTNIDLGLIIDKFMEAMPQEAIKEAAMRRIMSKLQSKS